MIRPATSADLSPLLDIWNPLIRDTLVTFSSTPKTLTDMENMLVERGAADQAFLVADIAGAPVGFATYGQFRAGIGYAHTVEHTIILGPAARGQGIGRALLSAIEAHAQSKGAHSIIAGVSGGNPEGRAFHRAMGYVEAATIPEAGYKFGQWWDLLLMQKFLT
ncbi:MAG: N-acetyltransferase family protein [Paracoccaceae bacterium]